MDTEAELIALKKEVAQLKQQLAGLQRFLTVNESDDTPAHKSLTVCCSAVLLQNPSKPGMQGMLTASEEGPCLSLWGSDNKARVTIQVLKDHGLLRVYQKDLKSGIELGETTKDEPYVGVLHEGRPRATMKATADAGVVSAVHDDGLVRVTMLGQAGHGEVHLVGGDMKTAVKLSSEGPDGGGFVTVNHANGKAAAILISTPAGGCVILNDSQGQLIDSLPGVPPDEDDEE